jgi:uncharacterized protein with gpF-like domain
VACPVCSHDVARALNRDAPPAGPVPAEALEFFEQKGLQPGFSFEDVWAEEHLRAFTAAKFMREDVLAALKEEIDRAIAQGLTFEQFVRGKLNQQTGERDNGIEDRLRRMGWWGRQEVTDPETGQVETVDVPSRLALIFDTNMRTARAAGQWQRIERRTDTHPFLMYLLGPSQRHRPQHMEWHGLVLPADDPFWSTHYPPNGYGCKCHVRQLSDREVRRLERDGVRAPEPTPVLDDEGNPTGHVKDERKPIKRDRPEIRTVHYRNKRTGEVEEIPEGIDPGFHRPPSSLANFQGSTPYERR